MGAGFQVGGIEKSCQQKVDNSAGGLEGFPTGPLEAMSDDQGNLGGDYPIAFGTLDKERVS